MDKKQVQTLYNLAHKLGWDQSMINLVLLKKFNTITPYHLNQAQMARLINDLQKQVNEKEIKMKREDKKFRIWIFSIAAIVTSIMLINSSHIVRILFTDEDTGKFDFGSLSSIFLILIGLLVLCLYFIWKKHDELSALKSTIATLFKKEDARKYFRFTEKDIEEFYYDVLGVDSDEVEDKANIV